MEQKRPDEGPGLNFIIEHYILEGNLKEQATSEVESLGNRQLISYHQQEGT